MIQTCDFMSWLDDYKRDVARYVDGDGGSALKHIIGEQGLWALLQHRVEAAVYRSAMPRFIKAPLRIVLLAWHKVIELTTGISLPCTAKIGPGLHLPHCGFRIVHAGAVIGANCCISQGVTIGVSGRGERRGVPVVGDRVYIGVNAVVVGKINIGNDSVIGANSLVNRSVSPHTTVLGVPAMVVSQKGSGDYLCLKPDASASASRGVRRDGKARGAGMDLRQPKAAAPAGLGRMRLLVAARVTHYLHEGRYYAYTPYRREIDVWAELFSQVMVAGTLRKEPPPGDCSAFKNQNVTVLPVAEAGGDGFVAKLKQVFVLPVIVWRLACYIRRADAVHARCPCDLGLLALLLGPMFTRCLIAKYATQWLPYAGEPASWRFQRWLLKSRWWGGPVTVYGAWPNQPDKVIPFFTSMLTETQIMRAKRAVERAKTSEVFRILFVGRLSSSKNADILLRAAASLSCKSWECVIVGEGPERKALEEQAAGLGIAKQVVFTGGLDFDKVLDQYERANALVLASAVEGWPKAIAEGMAFGLVCVGTERGMMPQMLGDGRGLLVPPRDHLALAEAIQWVIDHPREAVAMSNRAAQWAQRHSIEGLRDALRGLLTESWSCSPDSRGAVLRPLKTFGARA